MKVVILYRPNSEFANQVETYVTDFFRAHRVKIELVDLNTRDGAAMASLYDIVQYPAILAIANDGQLLKDWQGPNLPLMNEVVFYTDPVTSRNASIV